MTKAKETLDAISTEITTRQNTEREAILGAITAKLGALTTLSTYATLEASQQSQITAMFTTLQAAAQNERYIGNIIAMKDKINIAYDNCLKSINTWVEAAAEAERKRQEKAAGGGATPTPARPVKTYVNRQSAMNVPFSKSVLETKEDVEAYIEALKDRLMGFINQNKNIMLQ
jgi:hypothetical protein